MEIDNAMIEYTEKWLEHDRLWNLVLNTADLAWKREFGEKKLEEWISNFTGKLFNVSLERSIALWLLLNFTFYTRDEVRELCRDVHNKYLHFKLEEYSRCADFSSKSLTDHLRFIHENTLFAPLGNLSESGSQILFYYRQANELPSEVFEEHRKDHYENLVLIDDVALSGGQSSNYIFGYIKSRSIKVDSIYCMPLLVSSDALKKISQMSIISEYSINPIYSILLDERCKSFSDRSDVFSHEGTKKIQPLVKKFCEFYGNIAIEGYPHQGMTPLGFKNGQYLLGLFYNTPNNTLPIFWSTYNGWKPIFRRYDKKYELGDTGGSSYELAYI